MTISRSEAAGLFASSHGHRCDTFSSNRANLCVTFTGAVSRRRRRRATEVLLPGIGTSSAPLALPLPARWGDADIQREELRYGGDNLSADQISAWRDTSEQGTVVRMHRSTTTGGEVARKGEALKRV